MDRESLKRILAGDMSEKEVGDDPLVGHRFWAGREKLGLVVAHLDPGEYLVAYDGDLNPGLRVVHSIDMKAWRFFTDDKDLHEFDRSYRSNTVIYQ